MTAQEKQETWRERIGEDIHQTCADPDQELILQQVR